MSAKESQQLMSPGTSHPLDGGKAPARRQPENWFSSCLRLTCEGCSEGRGVDPGFPEGQRALVTSRSSGLKFHFRSQHRKSFFFLICVSCGKSEEKSVEHLLSLPLEGRKYAPSLLGKHSKHWCFHNPDTSWFSKPPAWQPRRAGELVGGVRGCSTWLRRFALGAELGICEFSTPSTSKQSSHSLLLQKLPQATGAPSAWEGAGGPRALDDRLPAPTKPVLGCWRLNREDTDEHRWLRGLWSLSLGDAEDRGWR